MYGKRFETKSGEVFQTITGRDGITWLLWVDPKMAALHAQVAQLRSVNHVIGHSAFPGLVVGAAAHLVVADPGTGRIGVKVTSEVTRIIES